MKLFLNILLIIQLTIIVNGITETGNYTNPEHPEKCVYEEHILKPGLYDKLDPKYCYSFECLIDGTGIIERCPNGGIPSNCKFGEFLHQDSPFPECCHRKVICDEIKEEPKEEA